MIDNSKRFPQASEDGEKTGCGKLDMVRKRRSLRERFFEKVEPEPTSGCHLWTGGINQATRTAGYGRIAAPGGAPMLRAHRVAWELAHGPIPAGLFVLHRCDVTVCVNPDHLYLGTDVENRADAVSRGRRQS